MVDSTTIAIRGASRIRVNDIRVSDIRASDRGGFIAGAPRRRR
jgi:hypothetical protein